MEGDAFIIEENGKKQIVCTLDDVNLLGDHNYENILANDRSDLFYGSSSFIYQRRNQEV